jgi:hypothetical protein
MKIRNGEFLIIGVKRRGANQYSRFHSTFAHVEALSWTRFSRLTSMWYRKDQASLVSFLGTICCFGFNFRTASSRIASMTGLVMGVVLVFA